MTTEDLKLLRSQLGSMIEGDLSPSRDLTLEEMERERRVIRDYMRNVDTSSCAVVGNFLIFKRPPGI